MQNPPYGPLPDRFDFNPTVDYAAWAADRPPMFAGCIRDGVLWCTTGHVSNVTNPPYGPLPDRFDFNPTVDWAAYRAAYTVGYVTCAVLVGP